MIKKICEVAGFKSNKKLLAQFPDKHWPLTTVKRLQQKIDDTAERSTENSPVEENEKLLVNKNIV